MHEVLARTAVKGAAAHGVSVADAFWVWLRVSLLSFGGPAGQIAVMHRIIVDEKKWVSEGRFLHALNYCMLLPGPEAQQLATYIGWLMHRTWGGIVAGGLFVVPGVIAIMVLSMIGAEHDLCRLRQGGDRRGAFLRPEGRRARYRAGSGDPYRQALAQERCDARACGGGVRRHLLSRCAFPDHHSGCRRDRVFRRPGRVSAIRCWERPRAREECRRP
jgi:hypothetical protein